jgi:predicted acyltransferase
MGEEPVARSVDIQPLFTPAAVAPAATANGSAAVPSPAPRELPPPPQTMYTRLVSLDAFRGFIMLAMVSGGLGIPQVARAYPDSVVWQFLAYQSDHVAWTGCGFWDLIQPAFMFMVGVAMPYSHASRVSKGASRLRIAGHTVYRCLLLILLGVFLSSNWDRQTNWVFVNVLCQIGLGYGFTYLLIGRGPLVQYAALAVILVGYAGWFASYSVPPGFNYAQAAAFGPWDSSEFFVHWNKNANAASAFDDWFLNLFPQPFRANIPFGANMGLLAPPSYGTIALLPFTQYEPRAGHLFFANNGGYATLNFIPSMATMILGLMAGEMLRRIDLLMREKFLRLLFAAIVCGMAGYVLGEFVCPSVKRIWTPTWALFSTGWVFAMLAVLFAVIDWADYRRWAVPLVVVGTNSIAVYCMAQLMKPWVRDTFARHLEWNGGRGTFGNVLVGPTYAPMLEAVTFTLVLWGVAYWMYSKKIFIKI